jgi:hypothetical protein
MENIETDATELINKMIATSKQTIDEKHKKIFIERYCRYYRDYSSDKPSLASGVNPQTMFKLIKEETNKEKKFYLETENGMKNLGRIAGIPFGCLNRNPGEISIFSGPDIIAYIDVDVMIQALVMLLGKEFVLRRISRSRIFTHQKEYRLEDVKHLTDILETIQKM